MRFSSGLAWAVAAALVGSAVAAPRPMQIVHPGSAKDVVITNQDTLNGTAVATKTKPTKPKVDVATSGTPNLPLNFINNIAGSVNAYVTGMDVNNNVVLLQPNGQWYYPPATSAVTPVPISGDVAIPLGGQGSTTSITLPDFIESARIWFAVGELSFFVVTNGAGGVSLVEPSAVNPSDPSADVNWGFVEFTNTAAGGLYANISYVDFVGLVLGMSMTAGDGSIQTAEGLVATAVAQICSDLQAQSAVDGQVWGDLCQADSSGTPLRVIAPFDYISVNNGAFGDYWTDYINEVWSTYTSAPLTIDTQAAAGQVACQVQGSDLVCDGDSRSYQQPVAGDIFGCNSGPFTVEVSDNVVHAAVVARLCAAFDRSTLLLPGGNVQPSLSNSSYYTTSPTNWYSAIVHKYEVAGKGYAFAYDDVNPDGENSSGSVVDANPQSLTITVGGPTS